MKLSFALLAHGLAADVARLVTALVSQGHTVALHYDLKSPLADFDDLRSTFAHTDAVRFAARIRVGWGEWSVVQATLNCLAQIDQAGWAPDYVYYLSGMDYPIRPSAHLVGFLERNNGDEFIETASADTEQWVKTGPQRERYLYRWPFNWRDQSLLTEIVYNLQKWFGLQRPFVRGLTPFIGSQWWVLTWPTLRRVIELSQAPDITSFFRSTLIPDELFFQTLVRHVADPARIVNCPLTLYQFSDYGFPIVFELDHYDYLTRQNFFFARKISIHRPFLRDKLDRVWSGGVQLTVFQDEKLGVLTKEYEDRRLAYRRGPPGRALPGRSQGRWYENQKRIKKPYVAILGDSTAELRIVHGLLARHPELRCHGQIYHPTEIELADDAESFAGFATTDLKLRNASAPAFLTDLVCAETQRHSVILLRRGQGWHIPELVVDRPNVRVMIVRSDPLIAFCEALIGTAPLLREPLDPDQIRRTPPDSAVLTFRRFIADYRTHREWLDRQFERGARAKPDGWIARIDPYDAPSAWTRLGGACVGLASLAPPPINPQLHLIAQSRAAAIELLLEGGIPRVVVEQLEGSRRHLALAHELLD